MPIYEYRCGACDKIFEVQQKISDAPLAKCKACGGPVEKIISQSSFVLKGSGWYKTDYASKDKAPSTGAGGGCAGCPQASSKPD
jgi:putative FmdB family regulatory protein